jgi:SAM-dependent methyltransferase
MQAMPDCKVTAQSLNEWLDTAQGKYVLSREQTYFDHTVADIFGFNALQMGMTGQEFLRQSRMPLRVRGDESATADVRFCHDELPFPCESMDLLLLPHVLEFAENPHQILREVERVLMPEGNLIISGFNPFSLWGLRRALGSKQDYPWCGEFIALKRLKDWLALLGFVVVDVRFSALARCCFMDGSGDRRWAGSGGVYFLHAIKRVPGMRLIQPKWNKKLVGSLIPAAPKMNNNKSHNETD